MDEETQRPAPSPAKNDFWRDPRPTNENPNFVRDYFASSRLHFIGSFRARYESMMVAVGKKLAVNPAELLQSSAEKGLLASKRKPVERVVVHVDMDCFFASVAVKKNPSLAGKCIAVCHGGGEISSCSYEARKFGVRAGMFFRNARQLCPELLSVPYEFPMYEQVSIQIYALFFSYPGVCVEAVSVDEAYLDVTLAVGNDREGSQSAAEQMVHTLRSNIFAQTGCTASAGIGPSKLIARLATKGAKPNGQLRVKQENIIEYLDTLKVKDLPGIGWRTSKKMDELGIKRCPQLRALSLHFLQSEFGERQGQVFYDLSRALDLRPVEPLKPRKSIGAEASWGVRFNRDEGEKARRFIMDMADEVATRVLAAGAYGTKVTYKVYKKIPDSSMLGWKHLGHGPCTILSRSGKISSKSGNRGLKESLREVCLRLHEDLRVRNEELRGVGLQMTDLLFADLNFDYASAPTAGSTKRIDSFFDALPASTAKNTKSSDAAPSSVQQPKADRKEREISDGQAVIPESPNVEDEEAEEMEEVLPIPDTPTQSLNVESGAVDHSNNERPTDVGVNEDEIEAAIPQHVVTAEGPPDEAPHPGDIPSQWDKSVFRALPESLQEELLAEKVPTAASVMAANNLPNLGGRQAREERRARKRKRPAGSRQVAFQAVTEKKGRGKHSEQVTMTQFADISELRAKGHDVLDAEEFREKPLRECVELLEDLRGKWGKGQSMRRTEHGRSHDSARMRGAHQLAGRLQEGDEGDKDLEIPSPPSLSSDSDSGQSIGAIIEDQASGHGLVYEEEDIADYAGELKTWMQTNANEIRSGHVELLRGRVLEFVHAKRLERACDELRMIKRFAGHEEMRAWRACYNGLVRDAQNESKRVHGFSLALASFDE